MQKCPECKREFNAPSGVCPYCGHAAGEADAHQAQDLPQAQNEQPQTDTDTAAPGGKRTKRPLPVVIGGVIALAVIVTAAVLILRHLPPKPQPDADTAPETSDTAAAGEPAAGTDAADADAENKPEGSLTEASAAENGSIPLTEAEILRICNDATAKVLSDKASFEKRRETKEGVFRADVALKTLKGVIYSFMGVGADNVFSESVDKYDVGYDRYYILGAALTEADILDAEGTRNADGSCDLAIRIRSGGSRTDGGVGDGNASALDKCGISVGEGDKVYWDHKTAQNMYAALSDIAKDAVVDEQYSNASLRASVDKNGKLTKLDVTFDIDVRIDKVYGQSCRATGSTTVSFGDFAW